LASISQLNRACACSSTSRQIEVKFRETNLNLPSLVGIATSLTRWCIVALYRMVQQRDLIVTVVYPRNVLRLRTSRAKIVKVKCTASSSFFSSTEFLSATSTGPQVREPSSAARDVLTVKVEKLHLEVERRSEAITIERLSRAPSSCVKHTVSRRHNAKASARSNHLRQQPSERGGESQVRRTRIQENNTSRTKTGGMQKGI
jgi:hypothetical protein